MPREARWVLSRQLGLAVVLSGMAALLSGGLAAISVLAGGLIGVLANAAYVFRGLKMVSGTDPRQLFRAQIAAEAFKILVSLALFALVFAGFRGVSALPLFLGYISTFVIYWAALLKWGSAGGGNHER